MLPLLGRRGAIIPLVAGGDLRADLFPVPGDDPHLPFLGPVQEPAVPRLDRPNDVPRDEAFLFPGGLHVPVVRLLDELSKVHIPGVVLVGRTFPEDHVVRSRAIDDLFLLILLVVAVVAASAAGGGLAATTAASVPALVAPPLLPVGLGPEGIDPSRMVGGFHRAGVREREQLLRYAIAEQRVAELGGLSCVAARWMHGCMDVFSVGVAGRTVVLVSKYVAKREMTMTASRANSNLTQTNANHQTQNRTQNRTRKKTKNKNMRSPSMIGSW